MRAFLIQVAAVACGIITAVVAFEVAGYDIVAR